MRVMIFAKEGKTRGESAPPTPEEIAAFNRYNEELVKAGVVLGAGRLFPSKTALRMDFNEGRPVLLDGPFTETKEMVAGYWLWEVRSMEEAVEWLKRAPFKGGEFEIRQLIDMPEMK